LVSAAIILDKPQEAIQMSESQTEATDAVEAKEAETE